MSSAVDCDHSITGAGASVVLVHGIGASRHAWDGLIPHLAPSFRCISYDLRGHGRSPKPPGPYDLDHLVADLERLRQRLDIPRMHVVGHSLGGMIGPAYARAHPERVLSLGLLSTAAGRTADDRAKVQAVIDAMVRDGIPQVLDRLVDRWFTDAFIARRPEVVERRLKQVVETDPEVFLNVFRIYAETEMAPWLHEVSAPTLVLTGALDGGCNPRLNRLIAERLPNSEMVILDGLKHAILLEAADQVAGHVLPFLQRQNAP